MDIWEKLYQEARRIQGNRVISPFMEAGGVAAALLTKAGNIYVGVCIDTACTLGMCAERNAIANMITNGEHQIDKLLAVMPDGTVGPPCGACREFMMQLDKDSGAVEILLDYDSRKTVTLKELIPAWWGEDQFAAAARPKTEVVAALIWDGDQFMACQRPAHKARGLLWEFVGGKVEPGETKEQALIRECREELAVTVTVGEVFLDVLHEYPDLTVHLTLYNAAIAEGTPQKLEHNDIRWITVGEIDQYEFCPADKVILERLKQFSCESSSHLPRK